MKMSSDNRFKMINIVDVLRRSGRLSAGQLVAVLGVSRATLSRSVRAAGKQVIAGGSARRTSYAARRALRGSLNALPLYQVDGSGTPQEVARISLKYPDGCAVEFVDKTDWLLVDDMRDGWFEGLPYPLQDMRPQGFLGRNFARHHAALLQVNEDPATWSDDDVLHALSLLGSDAPGDFIVGDTACRSWLEQLQLASSGKAPDSVSDLELAEVYPYMAGEALAQGVAGSSAGGEFPKFTALRRLGEDLVQHVLVKFSGSDGSPGTQRWADLLVCEHIAGLVLLEQLDIPVASSRLYRFGGRAFLEVDRFDRHGALGRSGVVSWFTLNATFFGTAGKPWTEGARSLAANGWLTEEDVARVERVWHFGQLIGNTDMHDGNLSFQPERVNGAAGLRMAPIYDMLPMTYAPVRGVELPPRTYSPKLPLPAQAKAWRDAADAAYSFWNRAATDERISESFRQTCFENAQHLEKVVSGR